MSDRLSPINPITGKQDGLHYTFGKEKVEVVLAIKLLAISDPKHKKFHTVASKFQDYCNGLRTLSKIPDASRGQRNMKQAFLTDWREKYRKMFDALLTIDEGKTYLLNLHKSRYSQIVRGDFRNDS